jgi:hypothetical protein
MPKRIYRDAVTRQRVQKETTADKPQRRSRSIGMKGWTSTATKPPIKMKTPNDDKKYVSTKEPPKHDTRLPEAKKKKLPFV